MKICDLQPSVRPYERLEQYGAGVLSDEELLAIVIRTGMKGKSSKEIASALLSSKDLPNGISDLQRMNVAELSKFEGIGRVKAISIKACMELGKRSMISGDRKTIRFCNEETARRFFEEEMAFLESEEMQAVYIDMQKRMILHETICKGGMNYVGLCVREVFRTAIRVNAAGLILAHNHPGGTAVAGPEDIEITNLLVKSGRLLGVDVIDHVIVAQGTSISMKKLGIMEDKENAER